MPANAAHSRSLAASLDRVRRQWGSAVEDGAPEGASIKSSALLPDGAAEAVPPMDATTPPRRNVATGKADEGAGDFVLGALLGKGGMGLVFRAGHG